MATATAPAKAKKEPVKKQATLSFLKK